jgi:tryptophanyl-tRNA synthetase
MTATTSNINKLLDSNKKLVTEFGATEFNKLTNIPNFRTFQNNLFYSHRNFDTFYTNLLNGQKSAIVSGLNPSGKLHLGHKVVFDTCLFFQREYNLKVIIPLSDDESYVSGRVETRIDAISHAVHLIKGLLAYGFEPELTKVVLDFNYPEIFNLAINLSRKINISKIKGVYGYTESNNIGLYFYPAVQAAHVILPEDKYGITNTLVPIGPDEDPHLILGRDMAEAMNYSKPSVIHVKFMPDINLEKMSKSRPDGVIYLTDNSEDVIAKIKRAFSGGGKTLEEHRKFGGNPEEDVAMIYLTSYFLNKEEGEDIKKNYREGKLTSREVKEKLLSYLIPFLENFNKSFSNVNEIDFIKILMHKETNLVNKKLIELFRKN